MTKTQIIKIFEKFLKKHNAYDAYCEVMRDRYCDTLKKLMSTSNPYNFVGGYFPWDETCMGEDYWSDLNDEWCIFLEKNKL